MCGVSTLKSNFYFGMRACTLTSLKKDHEKDNGPDETATSDIFLISHSVRNKNANKNEMSIE